MYRNHRVSLAAAFADKAVVPPRRRMKEIVVVDPPAGASYELKIGENNDYFTVTKGLSFEPTGDDEAFSGLFVTNAGPQAGVEIQILVVYGADSPAQLNSVT